MGPYCRFCEHRCFVPRILANGERMLLATCESGMRFDRKTCGEDFKTAVNPSATADA